MDFLEFYGLREDPFRLTPDPTYFFPSEKHNEALLSLSYILEQKEGFCLITGEPGTGKTTLLNVFLEKWRNEAEIALILTPRLSPEEFLISVFEDLGIKFDSKNKNVIIKAFMNFLVEKSLANKKVVIVVDEAQDLPNDTLEELRLLSNLETRKEKLLQIILIGQPELEARLKKDNLRQLNQRITVRLRLSPLTAVETLEYINYRLTKAGRGILRLDNKLAKSIYNFSKGIPRMVNLLTSRAMMSAYLEGSNTVSSKHIRYAISHLNYNIKTNKKLHKIIYIFAAILLLAAAGYLSYNYLPDLQAIRGLKIEKVQSQKSKISGKQLAGNLQNAGTSPLYETQNADKPSLITDRMSHSARTTRLSSPKSQTEGSPKSHHLSPAPIKYAVVKVRAANIRAEPHIKADKIGLAYMGEQLAILGEAMDDADMTWYKLNVYGNRDGWIANWIVTPAK